MKRQSTIVLGIVGAVVAAILLLVFWPGRSAKRPVVAVILASSGDSDFIGKPEEAVLRALHRRAMADSSVAIPFDLEFVDSGGSPDNARALFQRFASDPNSLAVIGPSTSGESIPLAELAEQSRIPLLSLAASRQIVERADTAGNTITRSWVFKFAQNDDLAAERLIRAMTLLSKSRVALLYSNDGFGKSGASVARAAIANAPGITLVHDAPFPAALDRAESVAAACPADADAVLIWGTSPGPALLVQALARAGHKGQLFLSHGNASPAFIASAGPACEGAIVVGSRVLSSNLDPTKPADKVILDFKALWDNERLPGQPSHFGGHARDAYAMLLVACTQQHASDRESVRAALERIGVIYGVTGTFNFSSTDHAGLTLQAFDTYRVQSGAFVPWTP